MTFLSDILIYTAVIAAVVAGKTDKKEEKPPAFHSAQFKIGNNHVQAFSSGNGMGVASVAGVASRNGRVSSYSSVYSHPGLDGPIMVSSNDVTGVILPATKNSAGKNTAMTITKEIDNKYTKGTVKISPGSVSVTSIAKAGSVPPSSFGSYRYQQSPFVPFRPFIHDPFFPQPIQMLQPRFDPWFPREMFKNSGQPRTNNVRPSWFYPTYNPFFNYWQ